MTYPCPACGYDVFDEPSESYEICPVCGWEDDPVQLQFPTMGGGANKESLLQWQQIVLNKMLPEGFTKNFQRCADWRPLEANDLRDGQNTPTSGKEYFHAAAAANSPYYWRTS